jgi:hypothetical protein
MAATIQSGQGRHPQRRRRKGGLLFWIKRGLQVSIMGSPTLAIARTIYCVNHTSKKGGLGRYA